jgi:hypothetical protein
MHFGQNERHVIGFVHAAALVLQRVPRVQHDAEFFCPRGGASNTGRNQFVGRF